MNTHLKYDFIEVNFYEYTIRMTIINDTKMYVVTDLLKQYNKINNTDKRFNDWIRRKDTRELLQFYRNEKIREIPAPGNNEDEFSDITGVITNND